jgi:hypothetical protein
MSVSPCGIHIDKVADAAVRKKLAEASTTYEALFTNLRKEIQKRDNYIRAQVNERMGRYPVCPPFQCLYQN